MPITVFSFLVQRYKGAIFQTYNQASSIQKCTQNKAHLILLRKFSGSIPEVAIAPQPLSCRQNKPDIRDPHEIWSRSDVF